MMKNVEHILLRFPEDTVVEISGSPEVIEQLVARLDGIEIVIKRSYFGGKNDA